MRQLTSKDLWSLEEYHRCRDDYRRTVLAHKANRQLAIGPNVTLYFEDRMTIQYQIQEMLRIERLFEDYGIQGELAAYNPLIPDGDNWKATMMIEFTDPNERRAALQELVGIEDHVWIQIRDFPRIGAFADEDLDRHRDAKTSAVHFLRFQIPREQLPAARDPATPLCAGIDHCCYQHTVAPLPADVVMALKTDLVGA